MEEIYTVYWPNGVLRKFDTVEAAQGYIDWMDLTDPILSADEFYIQMIDIVDLHPSYVTYSRGE